MLSFICVCSLDLLLAETLNRGLGLGTARVHHLGARVPFLVRLLPALRHPSLLFNMDLCSNAHTVRLATGWRPRLLSVPFPCSSLRLCAPSPNPALLCVTAAPVQASRDAPKTSRPSPPLPSPPHALTVSLGGSGPPHRAGCAAPKLLTSRLPILPQTPSQCPGSRAAPCVPGSQTGPGPQSCLLRCSDLPPTPAPGHPAGRCSESGQSVLASSTGAHVQADHSQSAPHAPPGAQRQPH